ncbi:hypothetical protein HMPREF0658_0773 [Hoylesella marshii DSM 16973 = JCM 13450]|uniref:Uncharacterized protein n=1 Tax=Hoylesella marshii DSM 16973 = JCM 13450 TaxID=862515 RepID=E0NRH2_9BACT|nr:hypothetical protein HMPREF0658_0773 [Hoylesella marshii DSM 16973 = JCM 13450]
MNISYCTIVSRYPYTFTGAKIHKKNEITKEKLSHPYSFQYFNDW